MVDWRRNLLILWFAQFASIFGFAFAFPFLPLYIRELGVRDPHDLALWVGVAGGAAGFALAGMAPLWGILADRFGRKPMLLRAMIGGGLTVALIAFARGPLDVVLLRLLQGIFSGTIGATTTLVATGTPRERVGWAMGVMSSAVALGGAVGPLVAGIAASYFGLRFTFLVGGGLLLVAVIPVFLFVKEAPFKREGRTRPAISVLRGAGLGTLAAVGVLLAAQCLGQVSQSGMQQLVVLKLIDLTHAGAGSTAVVGAAFAAAGLASAIAAVSYSRLLPFAGYKGVLIGSALLSGLALVLMAWTGAVAGVVLATFLAGFFFGVVAPATSAMLGLETPPEVQGRVFGLSASATAAGFAIGPLSGGFVAAVLSVPAALYLMAGISAILSALMAFAGREPKR